MVLPILGANTESAAYDIANSLRFDGSTSRIDREFSQDPTSRKTFTISIWVKRSKLGANTTFFNASTTNNFYDQALMFDSNDTLRTINVASGSDAIQVITNRKFRDVAAWYHIVLAIDTTEAAVADGVKFYINGVQETSFSTTTYTQNATYELGRNGSTTAIGRQQLNGTQYFGGYMAEINYIDGQQLDPSYFGETNDNGVWIPKEYNGTYGNNGFYLEFKQTGTSQNSSGIGADTSGNDEHFASTNLAATDVTTDTPTNNFATLNPLINSNGTYTLSEGNTKFIGDGSNGWNTTIATMGFSKGKWYWEQKFTQVTSSASFAGLVKDDVNHADDDISGQDDSEGVLYYATGNYMFGSSGTYVSGGASFGNSWGDAGDIISVAADFDNNKMYFAKNGTYQGSGNPSTGSNGLPISEGAQGLVAGSFSFVFPYAGAYYANDGCEWNFGNAPFSISSGNSDANGYGNFEYSVPSGYYALCTKNLAEYG
jgi:hypothetical protein